MGMVIFGGKTRNEIEVSGVRNSGHTIYCPCDVKWKNKSHDGYFISLVTVGDIENTSSEALCVFTECNNTVPLYAMAIPSNSLCEKKSKMSWQDIIPAELIEKCWKEAKDFGIFSKEFNTLEEAKAWGETFFTSKYQSEMITVDGKKVILCCTDLAYEDYLWNESWDLLKNFSKYFGINPEETEDGENALMDEASELRDRVIELFEEFFDISIETVYDEY